MVEQPSDHSSGSQNEDAPTTDRTESEDDTNGLRSGIDRRSILKLTGSAVAASGFIGSAAAATTRHGMTFGTVLNAVEDLGMDPTGNEPVDLDAHIQSDTLIEFPTGTYLIAGRGTTVGISNFGIRGLGSSHRDVQFLPPVGAGQGVLAGGGEGPYLIENMSMNERDDQTSALWFGLGSSRGGYMGDVEWLGRSPSDNAAESDYHINGTVFDTDGTWVFENLRAGLDLPAVPQDYPEGIAFIRSGPSHRGLAIMRNCVINERNSAATRWEAGPGVVQMENCRFINNQLTSIRVGGGNHPTHNCVIKDCYVFGDGSRRTTAPVELENDWPNPIILDNVHVEWDTTQDLRGVVDSPGYDPCGKIEMRGCVVRNESPNANAVDFSSPPGGLDGTVTIKNCHFTGSGRGIDVDDRPDSVMRDSCFDMPNGSISGIGTQNVSTSGCRTPGDSNAAPSASVTVTETDGLTVALSGADSSDANGEVAAYDWDVAGTAYTGKTVTHTFDSGGTYPVSLTVADDDGTTAATSIDVTVVEPNEAPTASISVTETDGLAVALSGADSGDSDGEVAAYDWDVAGTAYTGETATHTFDSSGTYSVSLTVTDDDGATASTSADVTVDDQYPNELRIEGTGTTTNYQFSVSGSLAGADDSLEPWDDRSGSTAEGWVTYDGNVDTYRFSGDITDFEYLRGEATVYLNGNEIDPTVPTVHTLEIRGTGTTTNYQFSVSGSLAGADDSLEPWDDRSGSTAEGWVTYDGNVDTYEFTGEVTDLTFLRGDAELFLDGQSVSPGAF